MRLFAMRKGLTSYRSPLIRIILCVFIWFLMFFRNNLIALFTSQDNETISNILTGIYIVIIFPGISLFYISVIELLEVYQNKHKKTKKRAAATSIDIEKIIRLVAENDIVEVELLVNGNKLLVGASADCAPTSNVFSDKLYYIGSSNYESLETFRSRLVIKLGTRECNVVSIDGCSPKHYKM